MLVQRNRETNELIIMFNGKKPDKKFLVKLLKTLISLLAKIN